MSLNHSHKYACLPFITVALMRTHSVTGCEQCLKRLILKQNIEWWLEITDQVTPCSDKQVIKIVGCDV